jgi:hypothetical protein
MQQAMGDFGRCGRCGRQRIVGAIEVLESSQKGRRSSKELLLCGETPLGSSLELLLRPCLIAVEGELNMAIREESSDGNSYLIEHLENKRRRI